jgi:thioredoxin 1
MIRAYLTLAVAAAFAGTAWAELPSASAESIRQVLASGRPTVIDLGAHFCSPCKEMAPILESLAKEYRGKANVLFVDVREDQAVGERFKVRMIPTQVFFNAQGKEVKRHTGFMDRAALVRELKAAGMQ